jgi:hypothetical protein
MRKRIFGAVAVGLIAFGIWLGSFWQGPGLGGSGPGREGASFPDMRADVSSEVDLTGDVGPAEQPAPRSEPPSPVLTVVVTGNRYRIASQDDPQTGNEVSLEEVRRLARETPGSPEGVRVRILFEKSATEGARSDLFATLRESGVKREEIQEVLGFID